MCLSIRRHIRHTITPALRRLVVRAAVLEVPMGAVLVGKQVDRLKTEGKSQSITLTPSPDGKQRGKNSHEMPDGSQSS